MDNNKHIHRKKHNRSHQDMRRSAGGGGVDASSSSSQSLKEEPIFGKLIERGSELQKFAQNILGPYCAVKKIDLNEQMYGVAEIPSSISKQHKVGGTQDGHNNKTSSRHGVQPDDVDHKKEKMKRKHRESVSNVGIPPPKIADNPQTRKKKASVRPYSKDCYQTKSEDPSQLPPTSPHTLHVVAVNQPPTSSQVTLKPTAPSSSKSTSNTSVPSSSKPTPDLQTTSALDESTNNRLSVKQKKVKKIKKRKNSLSHNSNSHADGVTHGSDGHADGVTHGSNSHDDGVPHGSDGHADGVPHGSNSHDDGVPHGSDGHADGVPHGSNSHDDGVPHGSDGHADGVPHGSDNHVSKMIIHSELDQFSKLRPLALSLSSTDSSSTPACNDVPDSGDVQHMLHELLNPPSLSLVTPIPTPSKGHPFIFLPTQSSFPMVHPIPKLPFKYPNISEVTSNVHPNESVKYSENEADVSKEVTRFHGSTSDSDSDSDTDSDSDSSSTSSRHDNLPDQFSDSSSSSGEDDLGKMVVIDRDESTMFTLEKLQEITTNPHMTITPIKKTPPHFQLHSDDQANLSPAKHVQQTTTMSHCDIPLANVSASLGFHPTYFNSSSSGDSDGDCSGSDSESSCDSEPGVGQIGNGMLEEGSHLSASEPIVYRRSTPTTYSQYSSIGSGVIGSVTRDHHAATQVPYTSGNRKIHRKKRQCIGLDISSSKKPKLCVNMDRNDSSPEHNLPNKDVPVPTIEHKVPGTSQNKPVTTTPASLLVRISLAGLKVPESTQQQHLPKPKATVGPYNVRTTVPNRRNTSDSLPEQEEAGMGRDRYSRLRNDDYGSHDFHGSRGARSRGGGWGESSRDIRTYAASSHSGGRGGGGGEYGRGHGWERDNFRGSGEDYWSDTGSHYERDLQRSGGRGGGGGGYLRNHVERKKGPEYYMQEARRRKKEADKIMVTQVLGLEKAKLYMESVTYFMRHGGSIEYEQTVEGSGGTNQTVKRNPYKMYSDTLNMIKYCKNMAGECKPLLVLCLRCQSALYWRMYLIKQPSTSLIQKELQEYFVPSKATQSKSPFPAGFSPLPSPASVGSTASTSSNGGGGVSSDPNSSSIPLPRHIFNKTVEHLSISSHINTCLELWRLSDSYMEQCRDFFLNADRKASLTIHYYSSVFQVASWVEDILKSF